MSTMTDADALKAMRACHRQLAEEVRARVAALRRAVAAADGSYVEQAGELISFLSDEVLPHAAAEELTLYRSAATRSALALALNEMTSEHRRLVALTEDLSNATSGPEALLAAEQVSALLGEHLEREDGQLLRRLYEEGRVNLPELVVDVRYATNRIRSEPPAGAGAFFRDRLAISPARP
jgi:hemerythrin-like domain-containing protein